MSSRVIPLVDVLSAARLHAVIREAIDGAGGAAGPAAKDSESRPGENDAAANHVIIQRSRRGS